MGPFREFTGMGRRSPAVMVAAVLGLAFGPPAPAGAGMITYTFPSSPGLWSCSMASSSWPTWAPTAG
jgi:hypothetical protein